MPEYGQDTASGRWKNLNNLLLAKTMPPPLRCCCSVTCHCNTRPSSTPLAKSTFYGNALTTIFSISGTFETSLKCQFIILLPPTPSVKIYFKYCMRKTESTLGIACMLLHFCTKIWWAPHLFKLLLSQFTCWATFTFLWSKIRSIRSPDMDFVTSVTSVKIL